MTGPAATSHVYVVAKGKPLVVNAPGLLPATPAAAAAAPAMPAPVVTIVKAPAHGKITMKADGGFTYAPAGGYTGTDVFTFALSAAGKTGAEATVALVVK